MRAEVEGMNRTAESGRGAMTARVHVVVSDQSVTYIKEQAFRVCSNLARVTAPFVEEVGWEIFWGAYNLRHFTFSPNTVVGLRQECSYFVSLSRPLHLLLV